MPWLARLVMVNRFDAMALTTPTLRHWWAHTAAMLMLCELMSAFTLGCIAFGVESVLDTTTTTTSIATAGWQLAATYAVGTAVAFVIYALPLAGAFPDLNGPTTLVSMVLGFRSLAQGGLILLCQALGYLAAAMAMDAALPHGLVVHSSAFTTHVPTLLGVQIALAALVALGTVMVLYPRREKPLASMRDRTAESRMPSHASIMMVSLCVGCAVLMGHVTHTGGGIRYWPEFAHARLAGDYTHVWVYTVATLLGSLLAAVLYWVYEQLAVFSLFTATLRNSQLDYVEYADHNHEEVLRAIWQAAPEGERVNLTAEAGAAPPPPYPPASVLPIRHFQL